MSACMSGTRGSGVLSSTGDVLVRGVGRVCEMCMCIVLGGYLHISSAPSVQSCCTL